MLRRDGRRWPTLAVAGGLGALAVLGAPARAAVAQDSADDPSQRLVERYAPIVVLKAQDGPCDGYGEAYAPMAVDALLDNPQVALRQAGRSDPVVRWAPGAADLFGLGGGFYLDLPGMALDPGCVYERDFDRLAEQSPPTVYAHIARQADRPDRLALQYWLFWYYNDWNDKHEGDWEFVQVLLPAASVEEALTVEPIGVGYAQHSGGETADWDADKLEREGDRPVVYSSAGSHASYFGAALYLGRSGNEGFGCDNTDGPSVRVDPEVVLLPETVDDPADPMAWLAFDGRWGERQAAPNDGPTGPLAKPRWTEPVDWHEDLRPSSFVIPSGDSLAGEVIEAFCGAVEWGSLRFLELQSSPTRLLVTAGLLALAVRFLVRRTSWGVVEATPLVRRRRAGEIVRASVRTYARYPALFAGIGLLYVPLALVAGLAAGALRSLPLVGDVIDVVDVGVGSLVVSVVIGGLSAAVGYVALLASVSWTLDRLAAGERPSAADALRAAGARWRELASGLLRAGVVVAMLQLTIVATPLALYLLVRWQFMAPAVVLEGLDGRAALARSGRLVRRRWWHTAIVVALVAAVVSGLGLAIGVLLLVVFTQLPLWSLSITVAAVNVLVLPLAAIVVSFLYGDAVAQESERDAAGTAPGPHANLTSV